MTTYDEISTNEQANFDFWTANARLCLACYKTTKCEFARVGFRSNIRNRRNKTYLLKSCK